ncbi:unnamed protein product [Pylaiella littoralis]
MDTTAQAKNNESGLGAAQKPHPLSPRPTLYPTTPLRNGVSLSPFALFSEEKKGWLSAASPALSFEELARILAEEWERLPEEQKTPYRNKADEERLRHETMGAAIALTQIGTPSLRSGPSTPAAIGQKARRCLDIGTPDWQSPRIQPQRVAGNYDFGYNDSTATVDDGDFAPGLGEIIPADQASLGADCSNITDMMSSYSSSSAPWASSSSATPCSSSSSRPPPPEPSSSGVIRRRADEVGPAVGGGDARHRVMASPGFAAASSAVAAAATSGDGRGGDAGVAPAPATPGSGGDKSYGAGSVRAVGFEIRAADGGGSASKRDGDIIRSRKPHTTRAPRGRPRKGAGTTTSSSGKKRKPPSSSCSSSSSSSSKRVPPSSSSSAAAVAAVAAQNDSRSQERFRKAEYQAGRELVSKMSKKDAARPKGPQSSYILFYKEKVASFKAAKPGMSTTELGAAVGEAWRGLSDEQRLPYTQRAKASRERYKGQLCTIARNAVAAASADSAPAAARAVSTADNH